MKIWMIILAAAGFVSCSLGAFSDGTLAMRKELQGRGAKQLCTSSARGDDVSDIQAAFGLFYLETERQTANRRLRKAILDIGGIEDVSGINVSKAADYEKWLPLLLRFWNLFGREEDKGLDGESKEMLGLVFNSFIDGYDKKLAALSGDPWLVAEDEMTDITRICSLYLATLATENENSRRWGEYLNDYCTQRAAGGLSGSVSAANGGAMALASLLNVYDFTPDVMLAKRVSILLDIAFADWAQDQFNTLRCGARSRTDTYVPQKDPLGMFSQPFICNDMNWTQGSLYSGSGSEYIYIAATTGWRIPDVVLDMLLDGSSRDFEYFSQRPAMLEQAENGLKKLLPSQGLLNRYSFYAGDYILGGIFPDPSKGFYSEQKKSGYARWIFDNSSQGLAFADGAFVVVKTDTENSEKPLQCIGRKNIMIFQQPQSQGDENPINAHVSGGLRTQMNERGGWLIFKEGNTWAAIKGLSCRRLGAACGYDWKDDTHLVLMETASPLVIVTGGTRYREAGEFVEYITEHDWRIRDGELTYSSTDIEGQRADFAMNLDGDKPAVLNDKELAFGGMMQFDSPMISSAKDSGVIAVKKDRRKRVYYIKEDRFVTVK